MELETVVQVLTSEKQPTVDSELTSLSKVLREHAQTLVAEEPCLIALILLSLAVRFGAAEVHIQCQDRKLVLRFSEAQIPSGFWSSEEVLEWWWLLLATDCEQAWFAVMREGSVNMLGWDGKQVVRNSGPAPAGTGAALEFQVTYADLGSPILSAMADKKILQRIREGFLERARFYPLPIYFNGVLWEWPLDIKLERTCSFTSYALIAKEDGEAGFAVAHPWAHGCRYFMTRSGGLVDMVSRGATDTQDASGNICYIPALGDALTVQRRLNFLRKRQEACIELSPMRSMWGKTSYLMGYEQYLLSPRTVVFGQMPQIRLQMRPLRARQLLMQTDQVQEASVIIPVHDGLALDPIFVTSKPGGLHAISVVPPELEVTRQGRRLSDPEGATRWAKGMLALSKAQQKPLNE